MPVFAAALQTQLDTRSKAARLQPKLGARFCPREQESSHTPEQEQSQDASLLILQQNLVSIENKVSLLHGEGHNPAKCRALSRPYTWDLRVLSFSNGPLHRRVEQGAIKHQPVIAKDDFSTFSFASVMLL